VGKLLLGFVLGVLVVFAVIWGYFAMGMAPAATSASPMPFEKFLAHKALQAAIGDAEKRPSPVDISETNLLHGVFVYRENCSVCHGVPAGKVTNIAKGMYPKPPQFFAGHGVTDDPVGETFWKVQNGIRLTGMPGFQAALSETEMWQVSQLLAHADTLPLTVQQELKR
jgi:thiosulfate dehydrogenase